MKNDTRTSEDENPFNNGQIKQKVITNAIFCQANAIRFAYCLEFTNIDENSVHLFL